MIKFQQLPKLYVNNDGVTKALNRLEKGSDDTPRSWFYENEPAEWILFQVCRQLIGMQDLKVISDWDLSKVDKFGPQGGAAPLKQRLDSFSEYFSHLSVPQIIKSKEWKEAKKRVVKILGFNHSGVPLTLKAVIDRGLGDDKYGTNSGFPDYLKRKNPEAISHVLEVGWKCLLEKYPCTLGSRATMGKTGSDARNIFMASMAVNVCGQTYQMPLQDYIRSRSIDFFTPWEGYSYVQEKISQHWDNNLKFGADYTKMDQHFNLYHGLEVFDVVKHYFRKEYWDQLKQTITYVFKVPILTNLGYVDQDHAMPSGSEWTNFLETVWNYIFVEYLKIKYHLQFTCCMGIGDDQLYFLEGDWDEKRRDWITETIVNEFDYAGLPGNSEKQEVSMTETSFLQRLSTSLWDGLQHDVAGAGVYSLIRNLTSQVFPERYHNDKLWDSNMFALRVLMICENCNQHPLFEWYVQFCAESNVAVLDFIKLSDEKKRAIQKTARKISNFLPTYNQEKQDQSILDFECVRIIQQKLRNGEINYEEIKKKSKERRSRKPLQEVYDKQWMERIQDELEKLRTGA